MNIKPMRTDASFPFAYGTMKKRLPSMIRDLQERNEFSDAINKALDDLHQMMIADAPLPEQNYLAPDASTWMADFEAHRGETWQSSEWFFAEMLFFREVINRVQYWQTGKDPYKAIKSDELYSESLEQQLSLALEVDGSPQENLDAMLHFAMWGNRADLSLPDVMEHGQVVGADDLLIDDRKLAVDALLNGSNDVHLITDNFGTELAMDLMLIYHLLKLDIPVRVHVKMNPTYVSDATPKDVLWMLSALPEISPDFVPLCDRLKFALQTKQLSIHPDFYWHSSRFYDQMPDYLRMVFSGARVIISKGMLIIGGHFMIQYGQ